MTLSELALRYRRLVLMVIVVLMGLGAYSYFSLPTRADPVITIREAIVTTQYPGLSPERMERLVTKTLEERIREVPQVEEITSSSTAGRSLIHVSIDDSYFDLEQIWDDVRHKVNAAQSELPEGASDPVVNDSFGDVAVVTAALTSPDFPMSDMFDMAQHVRDQLNGVSGTKRVNILGAQEQRVYIEAANARLAEMGIEPRTIVQTLRNQNIIRPGGAVDTGGRQFLIEPTGNFEDVEAIRETLIRLPGSNDVVPLRDIATVEKGYVDPPRRTAYFNGEPAIIFSIAMMEDRSVLDYAEKVRTRLDELQQSLPVGYNLDIVTYQADQVEKAVYGVSVNVLQTLALVVAVVILFLGLRTGLIVGSIVPTVMLVTLAVMGFADMTLQRMSLATLVIALGILVDNSIVMAEDFKHRLERGAQRLEALAQSGRTLAFPLLVSSSVTVLVFLPLMLADHISGEYTRSISLVMLITLGTSWVLAMTLTPTLCYFFLPRQTENGDSAGGQQRPDPTTRVFNALNRVYEPFIRAILRVRLVYVALSVAVLAGAMVAIANAPQKFFPDSDRSQVLAYFYLPAGVSSATTDAKLRDVAQDLRDEERFPHIDDFASYVGFGGPRFVLALAPIDPAPNRGFMVLNIDKFENVNGTIEDLRAHMREKYPGVSAQITSMYLGPSDSTKIEVQVKGPDADFLYQKAQDIEEVLADVPGSIDIRNDWENRISKIVVDVDQARARRVGVTSADIARSMTNYFSGRRVTEFREGDDIFPVVSRAPGGERSDLDRVKTMTVANPGPGEGVPLLAVADFERRNDFSRIERENMTRTITIEARNTQMTAEDMVPRIQDELDAIEADLPPGHSIEYDGVIKESGEARASLAQNVPLCLGIIVILLVWQFNSFRRPMIILLALPFMMIGVAVGLYALNADFGFMPILGIYALAGIVVNNAVVLIDRIEYERGRDDIDDFEAIVQACVRRLRPILMTTITTIIGLLPLIIFQDALFYGLATVMAFGLGFASLITLGLVPVLYSLMFRITARHRRGGGSHGALDSAHPQNA